MSTKGREKKKGKGEEKGFTQMNKINEKDTIKICR